MAMARFIVLCDWTEAGVRTYQETTNRAKQAREMLKPMGIEMEHIYWTLGAHDFVLIMNAPDGETMAAGLLKAASGGMFRSNTLRAFDEAEISAVLAKAR
jgi:uncharacterized protein with GYD domain